MKFILVVIICLHLIIPLQKKEIEKLKHNNDELTTSVMVLQKKLEEKCIEDCNCGWYEDFYYDHAQEVGANE